ncbi:MAG: FMN-binding glutamate synthase family protein [SAR86 cluster bacterium]|uniref:FMN-binding glutamate synthase family protein n=1 Tax=SAR86 cluster bacterium TaxID=2030880 RepID=A0A2A5AX47_9GAMM|nr:MAG: FMN-binding glutamate synthase family protein [SAR86 cluster bacterium]
MTPVVRLYWVIALVLMPLSFVWLLSGIDGEAISLQALTESPFILIVFLVLLAWTLIGTYELFLGASNLRRNYPVLANIRYALEYIRPEIQQYFIANNIEEKPFSRERRNLIYRRAKGASDTLPFGTEQEIMGDGYRSLAHSMKVAQVSEEHVRVTFGGPACKKPYSASRLNISAMSFGSLSSTAIAALNRGAALGNFAHNTGEGGISQYHLQHGGDIIWQIGTGYFGCRNNDGSFDDDAFTKRVAVDVVKMIEIKLSQGAKPSHGGVLPGVKVTEEIAQIRLVEIGKTVHSPAVHPEFDTPKGLLEFVQRLRALSGGKPVGFKLCLGRKVEFMAIVKAMLETKILPDFITIDGAEGGTGAAPVEFSNRLGTPCTEATYYIHQVLKGAGLRPQIKLISAGQTATGFDMLEKIIVGADAVNAARSMMIALGCVQAKACNSNKCPTGIATQNPSRARAVDVEEKSQRVCNFHSATVEAFLQLCGAMGFDNPDDLMPSELFSRYEGVIKNFDQLYEPLSENQLFSESIPDSYRHDWQLASAERY